MTTLAAMACAAASAPAPTPHDWKPPAAWYGTQLRLAELTPKTVEHSELRLQMGDNPRWAEGAWDDSDWPVVGRRRLPLHAGIFWLRLRVRTVAPGVRLPSLVWLAGPPAYDLYWDGALLHSEGVPGSNAGAQVAGSSRAQFELPPAATEPGEHVIALRMSTFGGARAGTQFARLFIWTVPVDDYRRLDGRLRLLPAMATGAMLAIGLIVGIMWILADRRKVLGLLAALCLSAAGLVAIASAPHLWIYPATWIPLQSGLHIALVVVVASLLVAITLCHLYPRVSPAWWLAPVALESALAGYGVPREGDVAWLWRAAFGGLLILACWAAWRRREGAWPILAGAVVTYGCFEADPKHFDHSRFLQTVFPLLGGLTTSIALSVRRERLAARDMKLTAARLEIELLRKSLQPHFLMNTLTALAQVIEENPAAAARLIDDLALEFRSLARFSAERQISLADELALCRAHLGVISVRTDRAWRLETGGVDLTASVPPALFLTLIENGFSHQRAARDATVFTLRAEPMPCGLRYIFVSPGAVTSDPKRATGGTGLRYVRARLEESFHSSWTLTQRGVEGGWETVIELRGPGRQEGMA